MPVSYKEAFVSGDMRMFLVRYSGTWLIWEYKYSFISDFMLSLFTKVIGVSIWVHYIYYLFCCKTNILVWYYICISKDDHIINMKRYKTKLTKILCSQFIVLCFQYWPPISTCLCSNFYFICLQLVKFHIFDHSKNIKYFKNLRLFFIILKKIHAAQVILNMIYCPFQNHQIWIAYLFFLSFSVCIYTQALISIHQCYMLFKYLIISTGYYFTRGSMCISHRKFEGVHRKF
jgi:hypothetical protein